MSAIWTGVSGMDSYSQGIANTGNNLANTSTTGFKSSRMLFSDMISEAAGSTSDNSQIGLGVQVGTVSMSTSSGGITKTGNSMNMAVTGDHGYFVVKDPNNDKQYYTRAGDFNFDKTGYLTTPSGDHVQGWAVDQAAIDKAKKAGITLTDVPTTGTMTDIQVSDQTLPAQATSSVSLITNLNSQSDSRSLDSTDPYFTMFKNYNANNTPPVSDYSYSTNMTVYDANGDSHTLTAYYSKVQDQNGKDYWEYMVTVPPTDDSSTTTGGTSKAGVLMIGTMTFSQNGTLENETAFTPSGSDPTQLSSWTQASLDSSGTPQMSATFHAASNASTILPTQTMSFTTGLTSTSGSWDSGAPASAADIGTQAQANAGFNTSATKTASTSTTSYASSSMVMRSSQDGYAAGSLVSTSVDTDGVISGTFSNGQTKDLYVVSLADFRNPTDLRREGNNLVTPTADSGDAIIGRANTGTLDGVAGSSLEPSNVDMATEMVNLITLQRAFESNSKVVTTANELMQTTMEIKK